MLVVLAALSVLAATILPAEVLAQARQPVPHIPAPQGATGFKAIIAFAVLGAACIGIWVSTGQVMIWSFVLLKHRKITAELIKNEQNDAFGIILLPSIALTAIIIWLGWSAMIWPVVFFFADNWFLTLIIFFVAVFGLINR